MSKAAVYDAIIEKIFRAHFDGSPSFEFDREEISAAAGALGVEVRNLGDLIYSFRHRRPLPASILAAAPKGKEWLIEQHGRSRYQFRLGSISRVVPQASLATIDIPDSTPEIVVRYAQTDEQALLAKLRYNRLIDIFLSITTYSLQNHLRTTVKAPSGRAQIEIDELYVGIDVDGAHYVVPVQAKGGADQIGIVQAKQDMLYCAERFPDLKCRPVAAQFMPNEVIALFELVIQDGMLKVKAEKHYKLTAAEPYRAK